MRARAHFMNVRGVSRPPLCTQVHLTTHCGVIGSSCKHGYRNRCNHHYYTALASPRFDYNYNRSCVFDSGLLVAVFFVLIRWGLSFAWAVCRALQSYLILDALVQKHFDYMYTACCIYKCLLRALDILT